jgi:hypothetical protein
VKFYVCPGTSAWNSLGGRWNNARQNILSAAIAGRTTGAAGLLITDWGDNGHWQQSSISYPGYLLAAAASWNPDTAVDLDIEGCLSRHIFQDQTGRAAKALMILENLYDEGIVRLRNAGVLAVLLLLDLQQYYVKELEQFRGYDFSQEQNGVTQALSNLEKADIRTEDGGLLRTELGFTADLMDHSAHLGKARFSTPNLTIAEIPLSTRQDLAAEMEVLIDRYTELWLKRSRPGGFKDSVGRMLALRNSYLTD